MENTEPTNNNVTPISSDVNTANSLSEKSGKKPKLSKITIFSIIVLGFILIAGVATAAYTQIVLNNPDRLWQDATNNTRSGIEQVSALVEETNYNGGDISGEINIEAPINATASVEGKWLNNNASISSETSIAGVNLKSELRAVENTETLKPDFYLKIDGLAGASSFSDLFLPGSRTLLEQANNKWYKIDSSDIEGLGALPVEIQTDAINAEKYKEEVDKIKSLINEFLLTTDQSKAAFSYTPIGKEEFNGRDAYKYDIKPNKERLQALLAEIESIYNDAESMNLPGINELDESINLDSLSEFSLDKDVKVEVWVDMDLKYFRNARIYLDNNYELSNVATGNYIDIGLDFKGDDKLPFYINFVGENNGDNEDINLYLSATLNQQSKGVKLQFDLNASVDEQVIRASGNLEITPSEAAVEVQAPEDFESIDSLIESFFGSGFSNQNTQLEGFDDSDFLLDDVEL